MPQTMHWSQTESSKCSLDSLSHNPRHPFSGGHRKILDSHMARTKPCEARRGRPGGGTRFALEEEVL
eukprot:scaffold9948_cov60-Phaeocystis_antarctica.AAC.1